MRKHMTGFLHGSTIRHAMGAVGLQTQFAIRGHCGGEFNLLRCLVFGVSLILAGTQFPPMFLSRAFHRHKDCVCTR